MATNTVDQDAPADRPLHDHLGRLPRRGSHAMYREYLDQGLPRRLRRVAQQVQEPVQGPARHDLRVRNWDNERRNARPGARRRRRRGHLPQHRPAVLPELRALRPPAEARRVRAPARRHPRPQPLARRLVQRVPRAARRHRPDLPQRRRRRDRRRRWIKEHGLRGGILLPNVAARRHVGEAALRPVLRPAVGGLRGPRRRRSTRTAAPAPPTTGRAPVAALLQISEIPFYSQRPFVHLLLSGVFERLPEAASSC